MGVVGWVRQAILLCAALGRVTSWKKRSGFVGIGTTENNSSFDVQHPSITLFSSRWYGT
jgi:hypothetical protein